MRRTGPRPWRRSSPRRGTPRPPRRRCWWTTPGGRIEVEPKAVEANGNGLDGNRHHDPFDFGPTAELVLDNGRDATRNVTGHAATPANSLPVQDTGVTVQHEEAAEPQPTLFSWAEFMAEEPMKPKGRSRKPKPATASLFEWALTVEMEREAEPIGAGHDAKGVALPNLGLPPLRPAPPLGGGSSSRDKPCRYFAIGLPRLTPSASCGPQLLSSLWIDRQGSLAPNAESVTLALWRFQCPSCIDTMARTGTQCSPRTDRGYRSSPEGDLCDNVDTPALVNRAASGC